MLASTQGEFIFGDLLAEADFAFSRVVLSFAVVGLHIELHTGDGDEHKKYTEDEPPVFDGGLLRRLVWVSVRVERFVAFCRMRMMWLCLSVRKPAVIPVLFN